MKFFLFNWILRIFSVLRPYPVLRSWQDNSAFLTTRGVEKNCPLANVWPVLPLRLSWGSLHGIIRFKYWTVQYYRGLIFPLAAKLASSFPIKHKNVVGFYNLSFFRWLPMYLPFFTSTHGRVPLHLIQFLHHSSPFCMNCPPSPPPPQICLTT